jgi:hypothetical protein
MDKNEQVFLAAAILLAAAVGQTHEPVDKKQVGLAVDNAYKLYSEMQKRHDEAFAALRTGGVAEAGKMEATRLTG